MNAPLQSFDDALAALLVNAKAIEATKTLPSLDVAGRILARPLVSTIDVPAFDNSAMDGYALAIADFGAMPARFPVTQRIAAGAVGQPLAAGEAARIFTGAPIPSGCNAVVMQEDCEEIDGQLTVKGAVSPGQHIRCRGEDITAGTQVLPAGQRLQPQDIALAASVGVAELQVNARLKVGLLFTGDELTMPGEPLPPGGIYNSNRYALSALLGRLGCVVNDYGNVPDTAEATRDALAEAAAENDVVISCGGVSVGEEDHVKAAVGSLGALQLWRIAMKPGKPLAFGRVADAAFIGLPGNPVSSFITFVLLARPYLLKRMGATDYLPQRIPVKAGFDWPKPDKRREFLRVKLEFDAQGEAIARLYPNQGSGVMTSLVWGDGLIDLPAGQSVKAGDRVSYIALSQLIG